MLELAAGDWRLVLDPGQGGTIASLQWRGEHLLRRRCGSSPLESACFPLVPFCNRIAHGRFRAGAHEVRIAPNLPGGHHPHALHGFGWLRPWSVRSQRASGTELVHVLRGHAEWPWDYEAVQTFRLGERSLVTGLHVTNHGDSPMPAGLGFHPYFERRADTTYRGLHRGEWQNDAECLPVTLHEQAEATDWWRGLPVGSRTVDTNYTGREGALAIRWPDRGVELQMLPSANLPHTTVYVPEGSDYFCVEPVSHTTDAIHRGGEAAGLKWLAPGETLAVTVEWRAARMPPAS